MPDVPGIVIDQVASDEDIDAVAALEAESFTNPWSRDMLARELRQSEVARLYVLRTAGPRVTAFCACRIVLDELHIHTIAVDPTQRRQGLATRLVRHVLAAAAAEGAERATLEVRRSNTTARHLYERLGFVVEAERARYYHSPEEDALILWLRALPAADRAAPDGPP